MEDLDLGDLAVFVRVVDRAGFASAARELGVPTSTVSRAIARLEARTGVRLLHRTTRTVRATTEGRDLYAGVAPAIATLRNAARAVEPEAKKPKGRLRVAAPNDLASSFFADVIVAFVEKYPSVQLDFALDNRRTDLVAEGFDVAVRAAVGTWDSSLVARKLGELEHRLYASPAYLEAHGAPASVEELHAHRCILFRAKELARTWTLRGPEGEAAVDVRGRVGGDDLSFVRAIVLAGGGIGVLPHVNCARDEARGALVRVLPALSARGATLYVVYPSRHHVPARVAAFRDFVVEAFLAWSSAARAPRQGPGS
jgi:DNA-binding transcriptional LysR family regulator